MTDPHSDSRRFGTLRHRRPAIAHVISTLRPAGASPIQLLIFHTFDHERPSLHDRVARRDTPDMVIELAQN